MKMRDRLPIYRTVKKLHQVPIIPAANKLSITYDKPEDIKKNEEQEISGRQATRKSLLWGGGGGMSNSCKKI